MALKEKKKKFRFTFQTFLRLLIFLLFIYWVISVLSNKTDNISLINDPTVLGEEVSSASAQFKLSDSVNSLYEKIPAENKQKIEALGKSSAIIFIEEKFEYLKQETNGFPDKQIKEIKKGIIKSIYEDMMKSVENN